MMQEKKGLTAMSRSYGQESRGDPVHNRWDRLERRAEMSNHRNGKESQYIDTSAGNELVYFYHFSFLSQIRNQIIS